MQVLVSLAVMTILMAAMASMLSNQSREISALGEKFAANDLARNISTVLAQPATCNLLFTSPSNVVNTSALTFAPATAAYPFSIYLKSIPQTASVNIVSLTNPQASVLTPNLYVQTVNGIEVQVTGVQPSGAATGKLLVHFNQKKLVRAIHDLEFGISLATAAAGGGNVQVAGCGTSGSGTCGTGLVVTGINPDGTPQCSAVPSSGGGKTGSPCTVAGSPGITIGNQCCTPIMQYVFTGSTTGNATNGMATIAAMPCQ